MMISDLAEAEAMILARIRSDKGMIFVSFTL